MTSPAPARPAMSEEQIQAFRKAYDRLFRVIDRDIGFPECVEASRDFILAAYEAAPALLAAARSPRATVPHEGEPK